MASQQAPDALPSGSDGSQDRSNKRQRLQVLYKVYRSGDNASLTVCLLPLAGSNPVCASSPTLWRIADPQHTCRIVVTNSGLRWNAVYQSSSLVLN